MPDNDTDTPHVVGGSEPVEIAWGEAAEANAAAGLRGVSAYFDREIGRMILGNRAGGPAPHVNRYVGPLRCADAEGVATGVADEAIFAIRPPGQPVDPRVACPDPGKTYVPDFGQLYAQCRDGDSYSRVRNVRIPERMVWPVLAQGMERTSQFTVIAGWGLPADARVMGVRHDPWSRCFVFTLNHPSFTPVPPGDEIPLLEGAGPFTYQTVDLFGPRPGYDRVETVLPDGRLRITDTQRERPRG